MPDADPDPLDHAVQRMCAGDEAGFREVYREVQPPLLRYLTVLVGPVDAEDVASEAWAQAFRDLDRFEGTADGFRGWVTTIGRHRALDHLRRRQRMQAGDVDLDLATDLPAAVDVEDVVLATLGTGAALSLIASLPRDQAEAIMLRTVLGFDAETAGQILGKRAGAVRGAAHRGLKALNRRLSEEDSKNLPSSRNTTDRRNAEGTI